MRDVRDAQGCIRSALGHSWRGVLVYSLRSTLGYSWSRVGLPSFEDLFL